MRERCCGIDSVGVFRRRVRIGWMILLKFSWVEDDNEARIIQLCLDLFVEFLMLGESSDNANSTN